MTKALSILLLLLYTSASYGFNVKEFYCCGQLNAISLSIQQDVSEKYGRHSEKESCCENEFNNLQVNDSHLLSGQSAGQLKHLTNLFLSTFGNCYRPPVFESIEREPISNPSHAPPIPGVVPIYILNCTYRI